MHVNKVPAVSDGLSMTGDVGRGYIRGHDFHVRTLLFDS